MSPGQPPQQYVSILHELPNAEYSIEFISSGKAQLKDGVFEEPVAPGAATTTKIRLGNEQTIGDVNGDGAEDAAVTLVVQPGGSGVFTFLATVLNDNGTARPVTSVLLGDRILVKSLAIQPGSVVVTMLTRKPDEPMSATPTVEVRRTFNFRGGKLIEEKWISRGPARRIVRKFSSPFHVGFILRRYLPGQRVTSPGLAHLFEPNNDPNNSSQEEAQ